MQTYPHTRVRDFGDDLDIDADDDLSENVFVEISTKCFPLKEGAGSHLECIPTNNKGTLEHISITFFYTFISIVCLLELTIFCRYIGG